MHVPAQLLPPLALVDYSELHPPLVLVVLVEETGKVLQQVLDYSSERGLAVHPVMPIGKHWDQYPGVFLAQMVRGPCVGLIVSGPSMSGT